MENTSILFSLENALKHMLVILSSAARPNRGPKSLISCTCQWVQYAIFVDGSDKMPILVFRGKRKTQSFQIGPENTNLVEKA